MESQQLNEAVNDFKRRIRAKEIRDLGSPSPPQKRENSRSRGADLSSSMQLSTVNTIGELGRLAGRGDIRRWTYKARFRPASFSGTPQSNEHYSSRFAFPAYTTPLSRDSSATIEAEIAHFQQSSQGSNTQFHDLNRFLALHSLSSLAELHSLLLSKDEQISTLQTRLKLCEFHREMQGISRENRLDERFVTLEMELKQAKELLETERSKHKEDRQKTAGLYDSLSLFQRENKALLEENGRLKEKMQDLDLLSALETQFQELKSLQSHLLSDNNRLQEEVKAHQSAQSRLRSLLTTSSAALHSCRKDLSQLTEVIRIVRQGEGVSSALILGHLGVVTSGDTEDIAEDAAAMRKDLETLRGLLADLYAEQSGHSCIAQ
jgi:hypothetical protein